MCQCGGINSGHLPVVLTILMTIALAFTYVLAVYLEDVDPWFPYISAAGTTRPESCVFGLFVNCAGFLALSIVYLRYRLVKELNRDADRCLSTVNVVGCAMGMVSVVKEGALSSMMFGGHHQVVRW